MGVNNPLMAIGLPVVLGTSGQILYVDSTGKLAQDPLLFWDAVGKFLGSGIAVPIVPFHAASDSVPGFVSDIFVTSNQGPGLIVRKASGSGAAPRRVKLGQNIGIYNARGAFAADDVTAAPFASINGGSFQFTALEPFTVTAQGTKWRLGTIETGTVVNTDRLVADEQGLEIIGFLKSSGFSRVSTQFDKTSDVTLANITGLTSTLRAGKTYAFEARLYTTSNVAGGVQAAIAGTATATAIIYEALVYNAAAIAAQTRAAALATAVGGVTAVTVALIVITGTITVNAAGTLTVQFAQNASNGAASSVLVGSTFTIRQIA